MMQLRSLLELSSLLDDIRLWTQPSHLHGLWMVVHEIGHSCQSIWILLSASRLLIHAGRLRKGQQSAFKAAVCFDAPCFKTIALFRFKFVRRPWTLNFCCHLCELMVVCGELFVLRWNHSPEFGMKSSWYLCQTQNHPHNWSFSLELEAHVELFPSIAVWDFSVVWLWWFSPLLLGWGALWQGQLQVRNQETRSCGRWSWWGRGGSSSNKPQMFKQQDKEVLFWLYLVIACIYMNLKIYSSSLWFWFKLLLAVPVGFLSFPSGISCGFAPSVIRTLEAPLLPLVEDVVQRVGEPSLLWPTRSWLGRAPTVLSFSSWNQSISHQSVCQQLVFLDQSRLESRQVPASWSLDLFIYLFSFYGCTCGIWKFLE